MAIRTRSLWKHNRALQIIGEPSPAITNDGVVSITARLVGMTRIDHTEETTRPISYSPTSVEINTSLRSVENPGNPDVAQKLMFVMSKEGYCWRGTYYPHVHYLWGSFGLSLTESLVQGSNVWTQPLLMTAAPSERIKLTIDGGM